MPLWVASGPVLAMAFPLPNNPVTHTLRRFAWGVFAQWPAAADERTAAEATARKEATAAWLDGTPQGAIEGRVNARHREGCFATRARRPPQRAIVTDAAATTQNMFEIVWGQEGSNVILRGCGYVSEVAVVIALVRR